MDRRCSLSLIEQEKTNSLKTDGKWNREIGKLLNRSHNVINSFLQLRNAYGSKIHLAAHQKWHPDKELS